MQISERVRTMKPSLTLSVNTRAMELRAQGIQVTSLAVGEPDFPTPKHICEAAKAAIDANLPVRRASTTMVPYTAKRATMTAMRNTDCTRCPASPNEVSTVGDSNDM